MQKRKIHSIYIAIVFTIMVLPLIMMNHRKNEISIIDNACLPELPEVSEWAYAQDTLEEYVNKRIGFREQAVYAYETANSVIFHKLEHNLYAFGENGHIMGNMPEYIEDYQHLNLEKDEEFVNAFAGWLNRVNQYLEEKNIPFLYFLAPDKKSVYPECMSRNINVKGSLSRTDMLLEQLEAQGLPYIYPREEFLKAKKENDIYYVRYDALHWNDFGNLLGNQMIDRYFCSKTRGLIPLDESQLELYFECREKMVQSCFYVYEEVPSYGLKNEQGIMDVSEEDDFGRERTTGDFEHYINTSLSQAPSILILHDSYMVNSAKFYKGRYREVVSVHNSNYRMLQDLVEHYNPDVVLFENAERILASGTFQVEDLITTDLQ